MKFDGNWGKTYAGYGELFGPMQLMSSVNAFPDKYLSFVSEVHRSVGYVGHSGDDFDRIVECASGSVHIVIIVYTVKVCNTSNRYKQN